MTFYVQKVLNIYNTIDYSSFDEEEMMNRVGTQIRNLNK